MIFGSTSFFTISSPSRAIHTFFTLQNKNETLKQKTHHKAEANTT